MADVCSCSSSDCHCKSIASYINQCRETGLQMNDAITNWKTLTSCDAPISLSAVVVRDTVRKHPKRVKDNTETAGKVIASCPNGSVFRQCASSCRRTCKRRTPATPCRKACRPGCECPAHLVWHESACIKPTLCPSSSFVRLKELLQ